jgi:hypothetical protein
MARDNSTGIEYSNHNPTIYDFNPTTSPWREKLTRKVLSFIANDNSTVVEQSNHNPNT